MIGRFDEVMIVQIATFHIQGMIHDSAEDVFPPGHRQFVEMLWANLKNDPEFELVQAKWSRVVMFAQKFPKKPINDGGFKGL